jgi:hypothetical protein
MLINGITNLYKYVQNDLFERLNFTLQLQSVLRSRIYCLMRLRDGKMMLNPDAEIILMRLLVGLQLLNIGTVHTMISIFELY